MLKVQLHEGRRMSQRLVRLCCFCKHVSEYKPWDGIVSIRLYVLIMATTASVCLTCAKQVLKGTSHFYMVKVRETDIIYNSTYPFLRY